MLDTAGIADCFAVTVSSEEVARGKPSPDVYLEAARRLGVAPAHCVAVEDSANGIRAAAAAGMHVIAYPNRHYAPDAESLALADAVIDVARGARLGDRSGPGVEPRRGSRCEPPAQFLISTGVPSSARRSNRWMSTL